MADLLTAATAPIALAGTYTRHELAAPAVPSGGNLNPPQALLGQQPAAPFHLNALAVVLILGVLFLLERRRIRFRR